MLRIPKEFRLGVLAWVLVFSFFSITAWQQVSWPVFSSPDETANYAFAQQDRLTSNTLIPTHAPGAPRSVVNTGTALVPASFVFFPHLLGLIGKISGAFGMLMFGPALAASAVLAWFYWVNKVFASKIVAWVSTIFLATFPTFWFYSGRGFWQNGVFTSLLILSIASVTWAWKTRYWGISALTGLLWGVTIAIRPSEISWLIPGILVGLTVSWRQIPWKQLGIAALCGVVPALCLVFFQWRTYNSPISVGYRPEGIFEPSPIVQKLHAFQQVKNVFFPFGTKVSVAWDNVREYGITPLSYAVLPAVLGFGWLMWRSPKRGKQFIVVGLVGGFFLLLLYGNYRFTEYPAVHEAVLDGSYLRYWLPLLLLLSLGWGGAIAALFQHRTSKLIGWIFIGAVLILNLHLVFFDKTIGITHTYSRIKDSQKISRWVVSQTPANAVIVAGSRDKLIFPRRHAIGFNGTVPTGLGLGTSPDSQPTYILLSSTSQIPLLAAAFPMLKTGEVVTGPDGITLIRLYSL